MQGKPGACQSLVSFLHGSGLLTSPRVSILSHDSELKRKHLNSSVSSIKLLFIRLVLRCDRSDPVLCTNLTSDLLNNDSIVLAREHQSNPTWWA
jgi:hypothetical protein